MITTIDEIVKWEDLHSRLFLIINRYTKLGGFWTQDLITNALDTLEGFDQTSLANVCGMKKNELAILFIQ